MRQPQAGESAAAVPAVGGCMRRLSGGYGGCWMRDCCFPVPQRIKPPGSIERGGFKNKSLTMTYFHTGCSTIIGAKSFHGPVRDGKGWYQLAMVIRHNLYGRLPHRCYKCWQTTQSGRHGK